MAVYNRRLCQRAAAEEPGGRWKIRHILLHNKSYCNSPSLHYKSLALESSLGIVFSGAFLRTRPTRSRDFWPSDILILTIILLFSSFFFLLQILSEWRELWVGGITQSDGVCAEVCIHEGAISQPLSGLFGWTVTVFVQRRRCLGSK